MKLNGIFALLAVAAVSSGCLRSSYHSSFSLNCSFESQDFSPIVKNDSVYFDTPIHTLNYIGFNTKLSEDKKFGGGFALSMKSDTILAASHVSRSPFCTVAKGGNVDSKCFAVFTKNPDDSMMPEHHITFLQQDGYSTCVPNLCFVTNTNIVANTMLYGAEGVAPFKDGDYLKLTAKAIKAGADGSKAADIYLGIVTDTKKEILTQWTKFDISELGDFDHVDFELSSNRSDIPLAFCLDNFVCTITIDRR